MKYESICRVCLKEGSLTSIFSIQKSYDDCIISCSDMLMTCASVTVDKSDGYPCHICQRCLKNLWSAYKFRRLCEKSFALLVDTEIKLNEIKIEKSEEPYNDNEVFVSDPAYSPDLKNEDYIHTDEDYIKDEHDKVSLGSNNNVEDEEKKPHLDNSLCIRNDSILKKKQRKKSKLKDIKSKSSLKTKNPINNDVSKDNVQSNNKILRCSFCPKSFRKSNLLIAHHDMHMGIKRYYCEICNKSYRSEKDHKNMHKRQFKFKCDICSKYFNTKAKLTLHIATHNSNREKVVCGVDGCTKEFISMVGLNRHRSFHDGLKNFVCHVCSKKFMDKYLLQNHVRRHTNERPYGCNYCDKRFYQSSPRNSHERRHTNTRNYQCTRCDKAFVCSTDLKKHSLCHDKELREVCRFCDKRFARMDNRKRHEVVMHGVMGKSEDKKEEILKI